ncbi:hypothetical protein GCM10011401_04870 [Nesterenkonia cremea]|uniref:Uncharacterized protein n=1 Tax=Nesterenkonia cremea TaxID=1882340 RepID=A0A917AN38_9MICC|nr:hypothetical protein GCM10011401_04870 [Nesterenkonia cremea]
MRKIPSRISIKISGEPKAVTTGRATGITRVSATMPSRPPRVEAMKLADRARPPSPFFAMVLPSSRNTAAEADPGMPRTTEVMTSEVWTTATAPMISAMA